MSSTAYRPLDVYRSYPEENPFSLTPPVYNLVPRPDPEILDTPELKQAALKIANKTAVNVFRGMNGRYPFLFAEADAANVLAEPVPFTEYRVPPPLAMVSLSDDVEFVSQVNEQGNSPMFLIRVGDGMRLLKIVSSSNSWCYCWSLSRY